VVPAKAFDVTQVQGAQAEAAIAIALVSRTSPLAIRPFSSLALA
jgi:hypothetical protein